MALCLAALLHAKAERYPGFHALPPLSLAGLPHHLPQAGEQSSPLTSPGQTCPPECKGLRRVEGGKEAGVVFVFVYSDFKLNNTPQKKILLVFSPT